MHKLIIKGDTAEREYALRDELIIGRATESAIRLDSTKVDDRHAKVCRIGGNIFVEDLDSQQGISVNGRKVARWRLKKGDVIDVAGTQLLYDEDDKPDPPPPEAKPAPKVVPKSTVMDAVKQPASGTSAAKPPSKVGAAIPAPGASKTSISPAIGGAASKTSMSPAVHAQAGPSRPTPNPVKPKTPPSGSERPNSLSKVMPAVKSSPAGGSSGRNPVPKMGLSGVNPAVNISQTSPRNSQNSSSNININSNSVIAQASLAATSARMMKVQDARPSEDSARTQKFLFAAIAVLLLVVLAMGGILAVVLSKKNAQQSLVAEALQRVKAKAPKAPLDVSMLNFNFLAIKTKSQMLEMLNQPDIEFKEKIPLYVSPQIGTQELLGEFVAYYVNDQPVIEQGALNDVLVFEIRGEKATYMGIKQFSRIAIAPAGGPGGGDAPPVDGPKPMGDGPPPLGPPPQPKH